MSLSFLFNSDTDIILMLFTQPGEWGKVGGGAAKPFLQNVK